MAATQRAGKKSVEAERSKDYRARQLSLGKILDATFGEAGRFSPHLWEQKAYLLLVGTVYEQLAHAESEVSTSDLVSLAKVLVDLRKAGGTAVSAGTDRHSQSTKASTLPASIAKTVRQVYGVVGGVGRSNHQAAAEETAKAGEGGITGSAGSGGVGV